MPLAPLPPWLNINQSENVTRAAQVGGELGADARRMDMQGGQFQQEMGLRLSSLAQEAEQQRMVQGLKLQEMGQQHQQFQAQLAQSAKQLQMEQERAQMQDQESKMRMNLEWTAAAKKFQAQQQYQQIYQQLVDSGMEPDKAAMQATMQVGPSSLGDTGSGTAGMWRAATQAQQSAKVPKEFGEITTETLPDGTKVSGQYDRSGQFHAVGQQNQVIDERQAAAAAALEQRKMQSLLASRDRAMANLDKAFTPESIKSAKAILDRVEKQIKALLNGDEGGDSGEGSVESSDKDPLGLFTK